MVDAVYHASRAEFSPPWSACSATSTSPRRRCTKPLGRRWSNAARWRACQSTGVARFGGPVQGIDAMRRRAGRRIAAALAERLSTDTSDAGGVGR